MFCSKVYGHGKPDVREKRLGIINALYAVKAAKEEGILPCIPSSFRFLLNSSCYADRSMHLIYCFPVSLSVGGFALLNASKELEILKTTNYD